MPGTILIVDDEAAVAHVLDEFLTAKGYTCVACQRGEDALELIAEREFDILLTDLRMHEMDGIELVRRTRALRSLISIICVSAVHDTDVAVQAVRAGADDYVLKPFNLKEIDIAVEKGLDKRQGRFKEEEYRSSLEARVETAADDLGRINSELHETKQYLESLINSTVDAIIATDLDGIIEFTNDGATKMLRDGAKSETLLGESIGKIVTGGAKELDYIRRTVVAQGVIRDYETELNRHDGSTLSVSASISAVLRDDGTPRAILAICKDMTEQLRLRRELRELSIRDSLTGLYNQRHFHDSLEGEIERARRQGHRLSLMLFDVDKFKEYNDSEGHLKGDQVLKTIGELIFECTRTHVDKGFRYGGDEFCVVLPETSLEVSRHIAERIRAAFESHNFGGATLSVGLAEFEPGTTAEDFIQSVDGLMYAAKRSGGNRVLTDTAELEQHLEG